MALPIRDDNPVRRFPYLTWALIVANVFVFLVLQPPVFQGGDLAFETETGDVPVEALAEAEDFVLRYGTIPCEIQALEPLAGRPAACDDAIPPVVPEDKNVLFSLLSSIFVHGSVLHLLGNVFYLWIFGNNVEDRLGRLGFLALYLVTGVLADLGHVIAHTGEVEAAIGASGAVAGLMGAYLVFHPRARVLAVVPGILGPFLLVLQVVYLPAFVLLGLFFVVQFFTPDEFQVAWEAHVAGMAAGALLALAVRGLSRTRRPAQEPAPTWAAPSPVG